MTIQLLFVLKIVDLQVNHVICRRLLFASSIGRYTALDSITCVDRVCIIASLQTISLVASPWMDAISLFEPFKPM